MTDRTIILGENDRASYRGVKRIGECTWLAFQRETESLTYVIDYSNWLGSETISSASRTAYGTTIASSSNTTTTTTQRLTAGYGYIDIKVTTSGNQIRIDRICIEPHSEDWNIWPGDYRV